MNLELEGIDVVEAVDGVHALELVEQCRPDLVTLDLVMPRMDGLTAAAALRADDRTYGLPLVMVTTSTAPSHLNRARSIGVDAYLTKPFDPDELVRVVQGLLLRAGDREQSGGAAPIP
jgi:CheY-like chemotaxis protein